jgi:hypothetical protein
VIEVEYVDRRMHADLEVRFRYASGELIERVTSAMVGSVNSSSFDNGSLTLAGLDFDVMLVEVKVQPQLEGDELKVRCSLRPRKSS